MKPEMKVSRRSFLDLAAGASAAAMMVRSSSAQNGPKGANDRIRLGLIGGGNRGRDVAKQFVTHHADANYIAVCDPYKSRLELTTKVLSDGQNGAKLDGYEDYRRVLERKDIDAVHIATPDHWHCQILIEAIAAGKDVYVEKPLSNTVERAVAGLKAYKGSNRVVQIGTQQRSGAHFQEAAKIVQDGQLGKVTHAVLQFPGTGYGTPPEPEIPVPEGLNWDIYQGPAPHHPFKQGRLKWRGWWDYGGGLVTDWGVHLTQIALWYLNAGTVGPTLTSASSQYVNFVNPEHDQSPDAFVVSWTYPDFVMSFTNAVVQDWEFGRQGNYFFGPNGSLLIHRYGYEVRPPSSANLNPRRTAAEQAALVQPRRAPWREADGSDSNSATIAHGRNFLDCIRSRNKPVADLEIGFYASLPCILGVQAIRERRSLRWDDESKKAIPA